jgi:hypothetical protein
MAAELSDLSGDVADLIDYRRDAGGMSYAPNRVANMAPRLASRSAYLAANPPIALPPTCNQVDPWTDPWNMSHQHGGPDFITIWLTAAGIVIGLAAIICLLITIANGWA